jgi:arylsulfatase B
MKNIKHVLRLSIVLITINISSCSDNSASNLPNDEISSPESPNILFIIADDVGKDAINGFTEGNIKPNTPNIDAIRFNGLSFNNFWVYPTCSPTRASIITGKYGYRTGVKNAGDELALSEITLQQHIQDQTSNNYTSAIVGKWHLSGNGLGINPESFGIDYYAGLIRGVAENYYEWQFSENGTNNLENSYITEKFTDVSVDWINEQSKPWFLWLAYNAPHTPFHIPPNSMHNQGNLPNYVDGLDPTPYYMAAIEAMDYQIGRLLDNIPVDERDNTVIIFIGDNGTPNQVTQSPYSSSTLKNTLYQGGINTPMFISGSGITRTGFDDHIINSTDLLATIAEIAGSSGNEIHDSKSFKTLFTTNNTAIRNHQYSEINNGVIEAWTISNGTYKLIVNSNGDEQMYNLLQDPYENNYLINSNLTAL